MAKFKIVTYNVQSWNTSNERAKALVNKIKELNADLVGLQEVTPYWNKIINDNFSDEYFIVGKYRLACLEKDPWNEKSPLLIKKDLFNIINESTFWLSSTPDKESIADECKYPRVCTFAVLEIKNTKQRFLFANTHLDHICSEGRENECKYLIDFLKDKLDLPVILTGDFNSESVDKSYLLIRNHLEDSKYAFKNIDKTWTWHDSGNPDRTMLIDYIFINKEITPLRYFVDTDLSNKKDISDHRPVILEFEFKN